MLSLSRDHVAAFILQPVAADRTTIECLLLFHPSEVGAPGFDGSDAADFWHMVNLQDWTICERVQRGMQSLSFRPVGTRRWRIPASTFAAGGPRR